MERPSEIGSSIVIKGEIIAHEDLLVSGRVEGSIRVDGHALTINAGAHLVADVEARAIDVEGHVSGVLCAAELIVLGKSAQVDGEVSAPSLRMEDGAVLQGKCETTRAKHRNGLQLAS
ncbi:MAG TPA: polymer-forming cytoskeletal protein [Vicinamibacterales bacterium]|nr:polymer-forming cytoskeletal protein [Vicinamibacterales bacterium]